MQRSAGSAVAPRYFINHDEQIRISDKNNLEHANDESDLKLLDLLDRELKNLNLQLSRGKSWSELLSELQAIGEKSKAITWNENYAGNVRNKFGYNDNSKTGNGALRPGGINFALLETLKNIHEQDYCQHLLCVFDANREKIIREFEVLSAKIAYAKYDKEPNKESLEIPVANTENMDNLWLLLSVPNDIRLCRRTLKLFENHVFYSSLEPDQLTDRFALAYQLVVIGETIKNLSPLLLRQPTTACFPVLQKFKILRDTIKKSERMIIKRPEEFNKLYEIICRYRSVMINLLKRLLAEINKVATIEECHQLQLLLQEQSCLPPEDLQRYPEIVNDLQAFIKKKTIEEIQTVQYVQSQSNSIVEVSIIKNRTSIKYRYLDRAFSNYQTALENLTKIPAEQWTLKAKKGIIAKYQSFIKLSEEMQSIDEEYLEKFPSLIQIDENLNEEIINQTLRVIYLSNQDVIDIAEAEDAKTTEIIVDAEKINTIKIQLQNLLVRLNSLLIQLSTTHNLSSTAAIKRQNLFDKSKQQYTELLNELSFHAPDLEKDFPAATDEETFKKVLLTLNPTEKTVNKDAVVKPSGQSQIEVASENTQVTVTPPIKKVNYIDIIRDINFHMRYQHSLYGRKLNDIEKLALKMSQGFLGQAQKLMLTDHQEMIRPLLSKKWHKASKESITTRHKEVMHCIDTNPTDIDNVYRNTKKNVSKWVKPSVAAERILLLTLLINEPELVQGLTYLINDPTLQFRNQFYLLKELAGQYYYIGKYEQAVFFLLEARQHISNDNECIDLLLELSSIYGKLENHLTSKKYLFEAKDLLQREKFCDNQNELLSFVYYMLARQENNIADKKLYINLSIDGAQNPHALFLLADLHANEGEIADSILLANQACESLADDDFIDRFQFNIKLVHYYLQANQHEDAKNSLMVLNNIRELRQNELREALGEDNFNNLNYSYFENCAQVAAFENRIVDARNYLLKARKYIKYEISLHQIPICEKISALYLAEGNLEQAKQYSDLAANIFQQRYDYAARAIHEAIEKISAYYACGEIDDDIRQLLIELKILSLYFKDSIENQMNTLTSTKLRDLLLSIERFPAPLELSCYFDQIYSLGVAINNQNSVEHVFEKFDHELVLICRKLDSHEHYLMVIKDMLCLAKGAKPTVNNMEIMANATAQLMLSCCDMTAELKNTAINYLVQYVKSLEANLQIIANTISQFEYEQLRNHVQLVTSAYSMYKDQLLPEINPKEVRQRIHSKLTEVLATIDPKYRSKISITIVDKQVMILMESLVKDKITTSVKCKVQKLLESSIFAGAYVNWDRKSLKITHPNPTQWWDKFAGPLPNQPELTAENRSAGPTL